MGDRFGVVAVPTLVFARIAINGELRFAAVGAIVTPFFGLGELVGKVKNGEI